MATTKTITPTRGFTLGLSALAALMAVLALVNVFSSLLPMRAKNMAIADGILAAQKLPFGKRIEELSRLREAQERLLSHKPAEPFAWARLAYLRSTVQGDQQGALKALRVSDLVSPYEPRQLPERALMWRELRGVESDEDKAYQPVLWQKAVKMAGKETWQLALDKGLIKEVEQALESGDPELLKAWKDQEGATGHFN